ncbi:hypothetical protein N1851_034110 [Merluccius polli]|uniref:Uncharacterized protein n=1 Tax=Merluccius polli TaxID=89951 RepID=A0AA47M066_MERPO|nr:hypothetical protein N1851_034110 [Merluccius polli]
MSLHRDKPRVDAVEQPKGAAALEPLEDGHEANVRQNPFRTPDSRSQISKRSCFSFAEREASVMRQKAELEASLHVLISQKMAAAAAEAAAAAYEDEEFESGEKRYEPYVPGKPFTAYERAGDYVQQHSAIHLVHPPLRTRDPPPSRSQHKTRYLMRRELDLNLTPREELDLLVKWLGADTAEQARRIRSVHVLNPAAGLRMECYGTPEAVEHALLKKIEVFPKLTNKDNAKLRELGDILLELECAKEEGYLQGLAFLDTAHGVNPIVEKLPYSLQERLITMGSKFKEDHGIAFPPFTLFSQFVRRQAKVRNDPSFAFNTSNSNVPPKAAVKPGYKAQVSVHKTEVTPKSYNSDTSSAEKKTGDPDRECPIHRKPHPLRKCRVFRFKPIEERKAYLKDNYICCCSSTQHMAKDCKAPIKCDKCNSERHIMVLHPGPPTSSGRAHTEKEESGEPDEGAPTVTSKCTEICGNADSPRSCAKICLIKAYPAGRRDQAIKMYAVLDEQSNKSLAKTEFFNLVGVKASPAPYTMKTCAGTTETSGRQLHA